jgi:predicted nucleotidyltransferase
LAEQNTTENSVPSNLVERVRQLLPEVKFIYLFGSHSAEQGTAVSDIDIAVFTGKKLDPLKRWQIEAKLAAQLNRDVDLVDLLSASTVMQFQVISTGKCLYDDQDSANKFAMQVTSMYQHLNVERAEIIKQFMESNNG